MDDQRRQQRKDRKTSRAQKKAERKAARAADEPDDGPTLRRLAKLMRATDEQLPALRARLLAPTSAMTPADLAAVRRVLRALDLLLDAPAAESAIGVHQAAALLEGALGGSAALPPAPAPAVRGTSSPPPALAAPPPAPAKPVLVPSFLREPAAPPAAVAAPAAVAVHPPAPVAAPAAVAVHPPAPVAAPAPVPAPPPVAAAAPAVDDGEEETATAAPHTPPAERARNGPPARLTSTAPGIPFTAPAAHGPRPATPAGGLPFTGGGARTDPLQRFPLGVYATVCAELQLFPQQADAILRRYGLSDPALREAVDRGHKEKIAGDPALRRQFDELLARAHATLRSGR